MSASARQAGVVKARGHRPTRVRHVVLWLTVLAYMVTYMDRVVISSAMPDSERVRIQPGHCGLDTGFVSVGLCVVPASGRVARGPDRAAARADPDRYVVEFLHLRRQRFAGTRASMIVTRFLFGAGEAGAFPIATRSLSRWMLAVRARLCARRHACGIATGRRAHSSDRSVDDHALRLAAPFFIFGYFWHFVGGLWYLYYRDTPRSTGSQCRRNLS